MVYLYNKFNKIDEKTYNKLYNLLPASRKQKADLKQGIDKKIAILEYFILKKLLKFNNFPDFSYNCNGKPMLDGYNFSISHQDDILCISLADGEVGVDIKRIEPINLKIANYIFTKQQVLKIMQYSHPASLFAALYAKREADIKLYGDNLTNINYNYNTKSRFLRFKNYIICESTKNRH